MGYLKTTKWQLNEAFGRLPSLREKESGWDISWINIYLKCFSHSAETRPYHAASWLIGSGRKRLQKWFSCRDVAWRCPHPEQGGGAGRRERLQHHGQRPRLGRARRGRSCCWSFPAKGRRADCVDRGGSPCAWAETAVMSLGESTGQQSTVESWHCLMEPVL